MAGSPKSLRQLVIEVEELGRKSGLSEADVRRCMERALQADLAGAGTRAGDKKFAESKRSERDVGSGGNIKLQSGQVGATSRTERKKGSRSRRCLLIPVCCVVAVIVLYFAVVFVEKYGEKSKTLRVYLAPYFFGAMRLIRRETMPLHRIYNVSYYFNDLCLVENPFYVKPEPDDCNFCSHPTTVQLHNDKIVSTDNLFQPLNLKRQLRAAVGWREVVRGLGGLKDRLDVPSLHWRSTLPGMASLLELWAPDFGERAAASPDFYLQWQSPNLAVGHAMRQLFPRSPWFSRKMELSWNKKIFIHGPQAKPFSLEIRDTTFGVYVQGSGRSRVHLKPPESCRGECLLLDVTLEERDMLVCDLSTYKVEVFPQGEGIHVGYLTGIV